ncbi:uncharacterized protein H6S33_010195 [Morchella sextelata]|uniref:uncharacterized protein n=1 Tax=Morchella sextelata TaxID=1174677 RepID=UPI001D05458F|nr:uncharacterized protein H6S33_010195 [Morchella sextelata]KAH0612143.1 hypothetical protein H6S33_010195 [Morchella sextelata]
MEVKKMRQHKQLAAAQQAATESNKKAAAERGGIEIRSQIKLSIVMQGRLFIGINEQHGHMFFEYLNGLIANLLHLLSASRPSRSPSKACMRLNARHRANCRPINFMRSAPVHEPVTVALAILAKGREGPCTILNTYFTLGRGKKKATWPLTIPRRPP